MEERSRAIGICALALGALLACQGVPDARGAPTSVSAQSAAASSTIEPAPAPVPAWNLPADWDAGPFEDLEARLGAWFGSSGDAAATVRVDDDGLRVLSAAATAGGERGLRAVLVLAKSGDPAARAQLLALLERRTVRDAAADGCGDAVDVLAAAALAGADTPADAGARLEALSVGKQPHPDVDVRVQCAASAIALRRTRPINYLLGVLRMGTSPKTPAPPGLRLDDLVSAQLVAARTLSARAGVPCEFRPADSLAARAAEADRLERLLRAMPDKERR